MTTSQQSTQIIIRNQQITIQSLEQRIIDLERQLQGGDNSEGYSHYIASEEQYRRIVETQ